MDLMPEDLKDFFSAAISSGIGSVIGAAIKIMRNPPKSLGRILMEFFVRVSIGTLVGGICIEWFGMGPWMASSLAAVGAICSDEILRMVEWNAQRLKKTKLPFPTEFDEEDKK